MKKTLMLIASIVAVLIASVSFTTSPVGTSVGLKLPEIMVGGVLNSMKATAGNANGKYRVVSFWRVGDAKSRQTCKALNQMFSNDEQINHSKVQLICVNLDRTETLFKEIVRHDELNIATQFFAEHQTRQQLLKDFDLEKEMKTYLVDPSGMIVAINPSEAEIKAKIGC